MTDDFIAGLTIGAGCAAQAFMGMSHQELSLALYHVRHQIATDFADLGAEYAAAIADSFVSGVAGRKAEIEAASTQGGIK